MTFYYQITSTKEPFFFKVSRKSRSFIILWWRIVSRISTQKMNIGYRQSWGKYFLSFSSLNVKYFSNLFISFHSHIQIITGWNGTLFILHINSCFKSSMHNWHSDFWKSLISVFPYIIANCTHEYLPLRLAWI